MFTNKCAQPQAVLQGVAFTGVRVLRQERQTLLHEKRAWRTAKSKIAPPSVPPAEALYDNLGDHQPYTATHKRLRIIKGFQTGGVRCQNLREQQNVYHPQDCTGGVHHGFCGGGARIVGFDNRKAIFSV